MAGEPVTCPTDAGAEGAPELIHGRPEPEGERAGGRIPAGAGERQKQAPGGHGGGVVVTALDFVPGVALRAVVAVADRPHDLQAFVDQPLAAAMVRQLLLIRVQTSRAR